jgi:signal transduction histidine kinase/CHASE1-domain containing sensor protein
MRMTRWLRGTALASAVLVAGLLVAGTVAGGMAINEREAADDAMERQTALAAAVLQSEVHRYLDTVETIAAALGSHGTMTAIEFQRVTAGVPKQNLPGAVALVFVTPADDSQVAGVQEEWRRAGSSDLTLRPEGIGREHLFGVLVRQLDGRENPAGGQDFAAEPEIDDVLQEARRRDGPAASTADILSDDAALPAGRQQLAVSLATPVRGEDGRLRGWVLLALRGQGLFATVLERTLHPGVSATLSAAAPDGELLPVAAVNLPTDAREPLRDRAFVQVAQRQWRLDLIGDPRLIPGGYTDRPLVTAGLGTLLSVLFAALVHVLSTRRARAMAKVHAATAELRAAEADARHHAALHNAVVNAVSEGVSVVAADGTFLLHNPAARQILGGAADAHHVEDWPAHHGVFRPDRVTPFPVDELPMVSALRGEDADGVEMFVCNAHRPDGVLLSASGRPLELPDGARGAVAVFHDVTQVRRYQADLAEFAAVVAHDLKSPLTAITGYASVAADALTSDLPSAAETARTSVGRVRHGALRMRQLIDDLLAYTTARDAPLHLRTLDLTELISSVIEQHTAHLATADRPAPVIRVGPLPRMTVDPGLLRHVVDNLVGNAVKYTPPGRPAEMEISAVESPGQVTIVFEDRGIGIPDSHKSHVFDSFYRVRPTEYGGTGLGLAICRRIAERHGGSIAVEDHPGGGTRFLVTLPRTVTDTAGTGAPQRETVG